MNQNNGTIGVIALYLLFIWLISAAGGAWLTERKGYGERLGLLFGLVLSAVGLILALALPGPARLEVEAGRPLPPPPPDHRALTAPPADSLRDLSATPRRPASAASFLSILTTFSPSYRF